MKTSISKICLLCVLILAVLAICLYIRHVPAADGLDNKSTVNTIMIGDSYSRRPLSDPDSTWPQLLRKKLGIGQNELITIQKSGYGFARKNKRFYPLVKKLRSSKKVDLIIIQSGQRNDSGCSKSKIKKEMFRLSKLIKKKYPNATIFYCSPNWNEKSKSQQRFLRSRKKWYKTYAKNVGWTYMTRVEKVFMNTDKWSEKDGHHPNKRGVKKLANAMYKSIKH